MLLQLFQNPAILWFILGLVFLLAELALPGLIVLFFGVGAWVTALAYLLFDLSFNAQLVVFIGTSVLNLILLRRVVVHKWSYPQYSRNELNDEFIGKNCIVTENIIPGPVGGKVSFRGTTWTAKANIPISAGETVRIRNKESIILFVEPYI